MAARPRGKTRTYNRALATNAAQEDRGSTYVDDFSEARKVWTPSTLPIRAVVYDRPVESSRQGLDINTVDLHLTVSSRLHLGLRLTDLRPDELEVLKVVVDEAFERARPLCKAIHESDVAKYEATGRRTLSFYRDIPRVHRYGEVVKEVVKRDLLSESGDSEASSKD